MWFGSLGLTPVRMNQEQREMALILILIFIKNLITNFMQLLNQFKLGMGVHLTVLSQVTK